MRPSSSLVRTARDAAVAHPPAVVAVERAVRVADGELTRLVEPTTAGDAEVLVADGAVVVAADEGEVVRVAGSEEALHPASRTEMSSRPVVRTAGSPGARAPRGPVLRPAISRRPSG